MSLSPLFFWASGFLVISLAGLYLSTKTIKIDLDKNGDLIVAMLTILGTLVSILLGLLVSSADEQYRSMEACVNNETTCLNEVFRLSRGLPTDAAHTVQDFCIEYGEQVIKDDWPSMKSAQTSETVTQVYSRLSDAIVQFRPANSGEVALQSALLNSTSQIGQNRGLRVLASRSTWTQRLLPLILTCAVVVLACSYLYAGRGSALLHSVLVGLVAITLGTNIGIIFLMTRPFQSEWAIQPEGFELSVKVMKEFRSGIGLPGRTSPASPALGTFNPAKGPK